MDALGRGVKASGLDVGFVAQGWFPDSGGVETHTAETARELAARGHRVHVLALDSSDGLAPYSTRDATIDGVHVRRMAYRYHDHRALADVVRNRKSEDVVLAWMAEVPCDVIHVHHLTGFGAGALSAIADVGNPLVMTLHDYWMLCPRGQMFRVDGALCTEVLAEACGPCIARTWPRLSIANGAEARGPDGERATDDVAAARERTRFALERLALPSRLFVPSNAALEVFARAGVERSKLELCEYGFDSARIASEVERARRAAPRTDGEIRIGVLGALFASKGVVEIAKALGSVAAPKLVLELHGPASSYHGDSAAIDELRELAARDPRIRLCGEYRRDELAKVLARLDGVAAPSLWNETFGIAVREARAAGLPVLVGDRGALADAAANGAAGLVVAAGDRRAWSDALARFASDAALRERWSRAPFAARTPRDAGLQLERAYVETIVAVTGRRPKLDAALDPNPSNASSTNEKRPGFLRRFFGR